MNLNEKFSQNIFLDWIDELLPDFERDVKKVDVPKSFTDVSKIESLGKSSIGVMVFVIQMDSDPTRRRVSITKDSFNLLKNYSVQNAIIAYFCPTIGQWRLSLLTSTATWDSGKVITKLSNLKRQSFVLGEGAKIKTPNKYLAGKVTDLADLKKRFSIEVVNKDFYKEISTAFNSLQSVLQLPDKQSKSQINLEFSVRLIGRIIFCWFLREKRSDAGISLISDKVLSLDAVKNTKDYYHKLLEPLFFEVLNKPLESRNFDEFDKEPFNQTPYLNGGLFSAQYDDYYERGRNDFQSKYHNTLVIPNDWLESFFKTLETYHFTIDENTSYDEELSIDPEMLGRIFENLLAEINPETGESARKSTGSYYTPRVIVDYMVDESLTLYLKNKTNIDEDKIRTIISNDLDDDQTKPLTQEEKENIIDALGKLKILDPACGSGAFPMGALQKIVFILQQIDPNAEVMHSMDLKQTPPEFRRHIQEEFSAGNYDYLRKLRVIRESIYGVDIQPIATEISRLRCFLTLVVDQAIKDDKPDRGIKPLPNLDFKFVTANTLIGLPKNENGVQQMGIYDNREKIERLKEIIDDYFNSSGIEREQLKAKFAQEQKSLLREMEKEHGWSNMQKAELSNKLIDWEPFLHKAAEWFDPEWMYGVKEGFDIVIANPPYIGEKGNERIFHEVLATNFGEIYYSRWMDYFYFFFHKSLDLAKNNGVVSLISTNYYLTATGAKKLRKDIKTRSTVISLVNLDELKVFESARGQHNMITILLKGINHSLRASNSLVTREGNANTEILSSILSGNDNETRYFSVNQEDLFEGVDFQIRLQGYKSEGVTSLESIFEKMKRQPYRLGQACSVIMGLVTRADRVSKRHLIVDKDLKARVGDGIYILDDEELRNLNLSEDDIKLYVRPYFKNSDIKKYQSNTKNKYWILYVADTGKPIRLSKAMGSHFKKFENLLISLKKNFLKNKIASVFVKRWLSQGNYFVLFNPKKERYFTSPKIIAPYRSKTNTFAYNECAWFASQDVCFIHSKSTEFNLKYVLAVLNSKLIFLWLYNKGKRKGKMLELMQKPLSEIPMAKIPLVEQKEFVEIVDKILLITNSNKYLEDDDKRQEVLNYESQVDRMVYKLYGLENDEIDIIEDNLR